MPFLDLEEDKRRDQKAPTVAAPAAGGPAFGAAGAAPAPAPSRAGGGSGFINLSEYMRANQGAGDQMAAGLADKISGQVGQFQGQYGQLLGEARRSSAPSLHDVNPALYRQAQQLGAEAAAGARHSQTAEGVGALLGQAYGTSGGYGSGMQGFDAFLTRSGGSGRLEGLGQFGGLDKHLGAAASDYQPSAVGAPGLGGGPRGMGPPMTVEHKARPSAPGTGGPVGSGSSRDDEERKKRGMQ
jgi:hypothetical protein